MTYTPKLLRVNLTNGDLKAEIVPHEVVMNFIGGRGLGAKYLYDELTPGIDPLSADNKLIFAIGPLSGTGALSFSRWMAITKGPLSNTYTRSVGGADFGAWLAWAGFQMIVVEGRAEKPSYLYVDDGNYEIRDAGELWGKNTAEAQQRLKEIHGERSRAVCIGPAGEKLVRYAGILSARRTAGRGGTGAVMGSKNLKAITINVPRKVKLVYPKAFEVLLKGQAETHKNNRATRGFRDFGTTGNVELVNLLGIYPTLNFREGTLKDWEKLSSKEYAKLKVKDDFCYACTVRCGQVYRVESGPYAGAINEGPEYETIWAFTGPIDSTSIEATIAADQLCDDLGMDTISTGNTIGFAYELFEKGILHLEDTGGLELTYGNAEAAIELVKRIANREGLGDMLAEGTKRAAQRIGKGAEAYAIQVKGLEMPGYEPRGAKRQGLAYITSNVGANHNLAYISQEVRGIPRPYPIDRFADEGNIGILISAQDTTALNEIGIGCTFTDGFIPTQNFGHLLASVTGIFKFGSVEYLNKVGERIYNLERAFNVREGFSRKDDVFPSRITTEPLKNAGPSEGQVIRKPDALLDEYYHNRGWDENGIPTPQKLRELGLEGVIKDIRRKG